MSLPAMSSGSSGSISPQPYVPPPAPQPYLPGANWTKPVAARDDINATATTPEDQQLQMVADGAPLRVTYGPDRIGADLADVLIYQGKLVFFLVWGEGEIAGIDALEMNDAALPPGVTATHYTGTAGQTADPTLVAAYASHGIVYADDLPGIAYSVAVVPEGTSEGFPTFAARIRGVKVYDPRTTTTAYSDNPALALADLQSNAVYGLSKTVDWESVDVVADACDELVGTEKRRIIGLTCASVSTASQWIETLRTYAGCFVVQGGAGARLVADRPGSSTFSFGASGDSKILAGSLKLKKRGGQQIPTVVRIQYTDTTKTPWATGTAEIKADGVDAGTTPRRESTVNLPGLNRYSQAHREGIERLNKLTLGDLEMDFTGLDEALAVEVGDIVDVSSDLGLAAKLVRITTASSASPGRPRFSAGEYDPAMYSDVVQAEPTYADTALPNPAAPPALTFLYAYEAIFQLENGNYSSRINVIWTLPSYAYVGYFRVEVYQAGALVHTGSARAGTNLYATPEVKEGVEYVIKMAVVTSIGAVSEWAQYNVTPLGKSLIPGDVPSLTAFEAGGRVYATAGAAIDIDILRYEWRYWPVGGTWEAATVIDRADALRMQSDTIPVGTWIIGVKAIDSILQYSANAKTATVVVSSDANSFFVDSYPSDSPDLTNMVAYRLTREDPNLHYITDDGVSWADKFPNAMSTYTEPLGTYHNEVTSTWLGEGEDFGQLLGGNWSADAVVEMLNGSYESNMGFSTNDVDYIYFSGLSHKTNARFARIKHEALTTSTMIVTVPGQTIRLDAVPRTEISDFVSSASAPTLVQLVNTYAAVKKIVPMLEGATARTGSYDRVLLGPVHGLCFQDTVIGDGTGNSYCFWLISEIPHTVLADEYLEYEVYITQTADGFGLGGMELQFTDLTFARTYPEISDSYGAIHNPPSMPMGRWVSRKLPLAIVAGKVVAHWQLFRGADTPGDYKAIYRNIRVTDGVSTTRFQIWASGEPSSNTLANGGLTANGQCGPANSFLIYAFDKDGVQIVSNGKTEFQGV